MRLIAALCLPLLITACADRYAMRQDWDHFDYDKITKVAKK